MCGHFVVNEIELRPNSQLHAQPTLLPRRSALPESSTKELSRASGRERCGALVFGPNAHTDRGTTRGTCSLGSSRESPPSRYRPHGDLEVCLIRSQICARRHGTAPEGVREIVNGSFTVRRRVLASAMQVSAVVSETVQCTAGATILPGDKQYHKNKKVTFDLERLGTDNA